MSAFLAANVPRVEHIKQLQNQMDVKFKEVVAYFGEDASSPEEFFAIFSQFLPELDRVRKDNVKIAERKATVLKQIVKTEQAKVVWYCIERAAIVLIIEGYG